MTLRGGFIGFGGVAVEGHWPGWLARPDVSIVAAADPHGDARPLFEQRSGGRWYDSVERMLAAEDLDFVDICTPPALHVGPIRCALERRLHVLCEKPLVLSSDDLEDLANLADRNDRALVTVHNWRHAPPLRRAADLIRQGLVGAIHRCRWETLRSQPAAAAGPSDNWRVDPAIAGGGILIDHGWHALYMLQQWLDGDPLRIGATLEARRSSERPIEDTATVSLEFPDARGEIFLTWNAARRANRVVLEGSLATIVIDGSMLELRGSGTGSSRRENLSSSLAQGSHHPDWFAGIVEEFLAEVSRAARRGRSLEEARRCLRWIAAAQDSSRQSGVPVSMVPHPAAAGAAS